MTFEELGLNKEMSDRLATNGIVNPSAIQADVFTLLREGGSVIALAKTGTGKTLAYMAPLVQRYAYDLASEETKDLTWGLVLVPTRELAAQAEKNLRLLTDDKLQAVVIVGGESERKQISHGEKAAIYIATPGRFLDLLNRRLVKVENLKCVVFDEADRILDMGFVNDIRTIRQQLPKKLQLGFFSATIHFGIDEMSYEFGVEASRIGKEQDELTVEGLDHRVAFVGDHEKLHALANFLKDRPDKRGIVFMNYKERAHQLVRRLSGLGLRAESLTSQLRQNERVRTMQEFRDNKIQVLVASDLASRGLDVEDLDFVINMDLPEDPATYLHRVGRTARAGKKGIALSLVGFEDSYHLEKLQKFLGKEIARFEFYDEELSGVLPRFADEQHTPRQASPDALEDSARGRSSSGHGGRPQRGDRGARGAGHGRAPRGAHGGGGHERSSHGHARPHATSRPAQGAHSAHSATHAHGAHGAHAPTSAPPAAHGTRTSGASEHRRSAHAGERAHRPQQSHQSHHSHPTHRAAGAGQAKHAAQKPTSFFGKVIQSVQNLLGLEKAAPSSKATSTSPGATPHRGHANASGGGANRSGARGGRRRGQRSGGSNYRGKPKPRTP